MWFPSHYTLWNTATITRRRRRSRGGACLCVSAKRLGLREREMAGCQRSKQPRIRIFWGNWNSSSGARHQITGKRGAAEGWIPFISKLWARKDVCNSWAGNECQIRSKKEGLLLCACLKSLICCLGQLESYYWMGYQYYVFTTIIKFSWTNEIYYFIFFPLRFCIGNYSCFYILFIIDIFNRYMSSNMQVDFSTSFNCTF